MRHRLQDRGAVTIEMTLVGIPLIFILIMTFEVSRGMWMYDTMAAAVKEGVRFSIVHGQDCVTTPPMNNTCAKTIADTALEIQKTGVGLDPQKTQLTFIAAGATVATCTLTGCASNVSLWPPSGSNGAGSVIEIDVEAPFCSALAGFWPGAHPVSFAVTKFAANSTDSIQF